jgi:hypothetical protein
VTAKRVKIRVLDEEVQRKRKSRPPEDRGTWGEDIWMGVNNPRRYNTSTPKFMSKQPNISNGAEDHISRTMRKPRESKRAHNKIISSSRAHVSPPAASLPQSRRKSLLG